MTGPADAPAAAGPSLLSSVSGATSELLFSWPAGLLAADPSLPSVLFAAVPPDALTHVVTHARQQVAVENAARDAGRDQIRLHLVPDASPLSEWPQDAGLVLDRGGVLPRRTGVPGRAVLADAMLTAAGRGETPPVPVPAGGNLLVGETVVLIGDDDWRVFASGCAAMGLSASDGFTRWIDARRRPVPVGIDLPADAGRIRRFRGPDGRPWREASWPGLAGPATRQPLYHLDLFVALAGRAAPGEPERAIVGDPAAAAGLGAAPADPARRAAFDTVAEQLATAGFAVHRVPLPLVPDDRPSGRERRWLHPSPLNGWVEGAGSPAARVTLPTYGDDRALAAATEVAEDLWRSLGFAVRRTGDLRSLARRGGGLNCASRILARVPSVP